ncbi:MAG: hypothetical protein WA862_10970 [Solirubrobacterales bacterium]
MRHPLRRELLRHFVEADGALNLRDLALLLAEPLSTISYNARELERAGAIALSKEGDRPGWVADFYAATWWVRLSPEILAALGLDPEEQVRIGRQHLDDQIAEQRKDRAFMARLKQRGEEDREALDRLKDSDD